jgi:hypothetical protein
VVEPPTDRTRRCRGPAGHPAERVRQLIGPSDCATPSGSGAADR